VGAEKRGRSPAPERLNVCSGLSRNNSLEGGSKGNVAGGKNLFNQGVQARATKTRTKNRGSNLTLSGLK